MILKETQLCTLDNGPRPAGPRNECFYCHVKVGTEHKKDCVTRRRTVVIRAIFEYVIEAPESWSSEDIVSHRIDGSWCANNAIGEIAAAAKMEGCLCGPMSNFEFVREAWEEETARYSKSAGRDRG